MLLPEFIAIEGRIPDTMGDLNGRLQGTVGRLGFDQEIGIGDRIVAIVGVQGQADNQGMAGVEADLFYHGFDSLGWHHGVRCDRALC